VTGFARIRAEPYLWPSDGRWGRADSALLLVDPGAAAERTLAACREAGLPVLFAGPGELEPGAGEPVVERAGDSAFHGTDLAHLLALRGVRNLVLAGRPTEGAVHGTMREANDRGLECLLIEDACGSGEARFHDAVPRITRFGNGLFGCTATTAALAPALRA
jgi:Isochorismatase family